jgi:hypothetical protein
MKLSKENLANLSNDYTDREIAEMYNLTEGAVRQRRRRAGIPSFTDKTGLIKVNGVPVSRSQSMSQREVHKQIKQRFVHPVVREGWVTFFDQVDSRSKAYFLGLAATDGCVKSDLRSFALTLHKQDEAILFRFKQDAGFENQITSGKNNNGTECRSVQLSSIHLCEALVSWGITPRKTTTLKLVKPIPHEFEADFVRGCWDGDGYIAQNEFSLVSASYDFISQLHQMILRRTGCNLVLKPKTNTRCWTLRANHSHNKAVQWIYANPNPSLERKAIQVSRYWSN